MSGNRSLDEFADAGADGGAADERSTEGDLPGERTDAKTDPAADDGRSCDGTTDDRGSVDRVIDDEEGVDDEPGGTATGDDAGAEALDPPASTYVWRPDGGPCAGCGATVEERWRDGDDLVCTGCKEW